MRGGALFNGKEGRGDFRKNSFFNGKEGRVGFRKDTPISLRVIEVVIFYSSFSKRNAKF